MKKKHTQAGLTIRELLDQLAAFPDDSEITFGATLDGVPLEYFRVHSRGPGLVQIELCEDTDYLQRR